MPSVGFGRPVVRAVLATGRGHAGQRPTDTGGRRRQRLATHADQAGQQHKGSQQIRLGEGAQEGPVLDNGATPRSVEAAQQQRQVQMAQVAATRWVCDPDPRELLH